MLFVHFNVLAQSGTPPKLFELKLKRSQVTTALQKLSEQTGYAVVYSPSDVKSYQSNALYGHYAPQQALDYLLEGTPLSGHFQPGVGIRVFYDTVKLTELLRQSMQEPASEQTPNTSPQITEFEPEVITIKGNLNQASGELIRKRYADFIVDSVDAHSLGQLPMHDIASNLQRISGVSIEKRDDQGVFASVRGFGPEFNTVLYNGRVIATENHGREFSFDVLSPEVISSADVYKSSTTDVLTGSIGSTINLRIPKPMQHKGFHSFTNLATQFNNLSNNWSPVFASLLSYSNEQFGALVSFNYQNIDYRTDSVHTNGWFKTDLSYVGNQQGDGDFTQVWVPRNFDLRLDQGNKKRVGGSIVVEAELTEQLKATFDILYSEYQIDSNISSNANWTHIYSANQIQDYQSIQFANVNQNNSLLAYQYRSDKNYATDFVQLNRSRPTQTGQLGLNFLWTVSNQLNVEFDLAYSSAANKNGGNKKFIVAGAPNANPIYEYIPGEDYAHLSYETPVSVSDLRSHGTIYLGDDIVDLIAQFRVDAEYIIDKGVFESIFVGSYFSNREKLNVGFRSPWGWEFSGYEFDVPDELFQTLEVNDFLQGSVPDVWYKFNAQDYVNYLWSDKHIQEHIINTDHWLAESIWVRKAAGGVAPVEYPNNTWQVSEKINESYIKANFSGDWNWQPWQINLGLRYSQTQVASQGNEQHITQIDYIETDPTNLSLTLSDPTSVVKHHDYAYWLAAFNAKYELTEDHIIRFALYNTISRPSLDKLTATIGQYNARVGASTAKAGNPYLMPYEASNLDLAWAWYFDGGSYFSTNYFYKVIDNFISESANQESLYAHPEGQFLVVRPKNGRSTQVQGLELALGARLDPLANWLKGAELQARYTFVDGQTSEHANIEEVDYLVEGLSDSFNLVASYQNAYLKALLSLSHRDNYLRKAKAGLGQPEMVEAYTQMDFSFSWFQGKNIEYYLEARNLLGANQRTFSVYQERLLHFENTGKSLNLGLRFKY